MQVVSFTYLQTERKVGKVGKKVPLFSRARSIVEAVPRYHDLAYKNKSKNK